MNKRILTVCLALIMSVFMFAACGKKEAGDVTTSTTNKQTTSSSTTKEDTLGEDISTGLDEAGENLSTILDPTETTK